MHALLEARPMRCNEEEKCAGCFGLSRRGDDAPRAAGVVGSYCERLCNVRYGLLLPERPSFELVVSWGLQPGALLMVGGESSVLGADGQAVWVALQVSTSDSDLNP